MARHTFTDEEALTLRKEYENGATLQQLVDRYGSYMTTIARTIRRVGGTVRPPGYIPEDRPRKGLLGWLSS